MTLDNHNGTIACSTPRTSSSINATHARKQDIRELQKDPSDQYAAAPLEVCMGVEGLTGGKGRD